MMRMAILLSAILIVHASGCGKKFMPVAPESVTPTSVKSFRVVSRNGAIIVTFNAPSKNSDGSKLTDLAGYMIRRRIHEDAEGCKGCPLVFTDVHNIDSDRVKLIEGGRITFRDTNLTQGSTYQYKASAYNRDGNEGPASISGLFSWNTPPGRPLNLKAKGEDKAAELTWSQPTTGGFDSGVPEVLGYNIYRRVEGEGYALDPQNNEYIESERYQDFGLENEKVYYYTVRALISVKGNIIEGPSAEEEAVTPHETVID